MPTDSLNVFLQVWIQLNYVEVNLFLLFPRFRFEKKINTSVYQFMCKEQFLKSKAKGKIQKKEQSKGFELKWIPVHTKIPSNILSDNFRVVVSDVFKFFILRRCIDNYRYVKHQLWNIGNFIVLKLSGQPI